MIVQGQGYKNLSKQFQPIGQEDPTFNGIQLKSLHGL
jgi:hypothetical protein